MTHPNFRRRMEVKEIWTVSAPSFVGIKLIELNIVPWNHQASELLTIQQLVEIAISYDLRIPYVIYEVFLKDIIQKQSIQQQAMQENVFPLCPLNTSESNNDTYITYPTSSIKVNSSEVEGSHHESPSTSKGSSSYISSTASSFVTTAPQIGNDPPVPKYSITSEHVIENFKKRNKKYDHCDTEHQEKSCPR